MEKIDKKLLRIIDAQTAPSSTSMIEENKT